MGAFFPTMTPKQLTRLCESIYGDGWQSALARDLAVADRTVRRWVAGDFKIPDDIADRLKTIIGSRINQHKRDIEHLQHLGSKL